MKKIAIPIPIFPKEITHQHQTIQMCPSSTTTKKLKRITNMTFKGNQQMSQTETIPKTFERNNLYRVFELL